MVEQIGVSKAAKELGLQKIAAVSLADYTACLVYCCMLRGYK
jgi:hypothetical protein